MTTIEKAYALLAEARGSEAVALLEAAGTRGDGAALLELGYWFLEGRTGTRDLQRSRLAFGESAAAGNAEAGMIHLAFIAQGIGGPADWQEGLRLLRELAKESHTAQVAADLIGRMHIDEFGRPTDLPAPKRVSERPDVKIFPALLTREESQALVSIAKPMLSPSVVIHPSTGQAVPHPVRTSDNASFPYVLETPFIHALNMRFAAASQTAVEWGEPLQVLRYRPGQQYRPHFDALPATENQRIITMIAYLNDGYAGGETHFTSTGAAITSRTGDVLMFRNVQADGRPDPLTQHAGLPVRSGEKFIATRWIRRAPFGPR